MASLLEIGKINSQTRALNKHIATTFNSNLMVVIEIPENIFELAIEYGYVTRCRACRGFIEDMSSFVYMNDAGVWCSLLYGNPKDEGNPHKALAEIVVKSKMRFDLEKERHVYKHAKRHIGKMVIGTDKCKSDWVHYHLSSNRPPVITTEAYDRLINIIKYMIKLAGGVKNLNTRLELLHNTLMASGDAIDSVFTDTITLIKERVTEDNEDKAKISDIAYGILTTLSKRHGDHTKIYRAIAHWNSSSRGALAIATIIEPDDIATHLAKYRAMTNGSTYRIRDTAKATAENTAIN